MATLQNLVVRISGNTASLNKAIDKAQSRMQRFRSSVKGAFGALRRLAVGAAVLGGAAILGFAVAAVKNFIEVGDEIQKMAERTGLSTEALSELRFAAEKAGTDLDTVEKAVKRMATTLYDAELGLSTSTDALAALGIGLEELQGLDPEAQFIKLLNAIAAIEDPTLRAALAQRIFGRAGTALLPLLADGTAGFEALRQEARDLGVVLSQDAADSAADFNDALTELKGAAFAAFLPLGGVIVPILTDFARWFTKNIPNIKNFFTEVGAAVKPFTDAFLSGLGLIYDIYFKFLNYLLDNKPVLIAVLAAIGIAIVAAFGPVSLAFIAIVGLIALIGFLRDNWSSVKEVFETVSNAILGFFRSKWAWMLPGGAFIKGILFLADNWRAIWSGMKTAFRAAADFIVSGINDIIANINRLTNALNFIPGLDIGSIPSIPGFRTGVEDFGGGFAKVHGGEIITYLPPGSGVTPAGQGMGGGGMTVSLNFYGDVLTGEDFDERVNKALLAFERAGN